MPTAIDGLGAGWPATQSQQATESSLQALGGIGSDGFLKLLIAQLQYQSPLDPKDPGDLMVQTSQLAQLDATQQMIALQQRDLGLQQAVAAAGLLGAEVTATGADGALVAGTVEAVRYTEQGPVLDVGGTEVALGAVREIRRTAAETTAPASPDPTPDPTVTDPTTVPTSGADGVGTDA